MTTKVKRPLKRFYKVRLRENESIDLKNYTTEKVSFEFLKGAPRLIKKKNGKYVAKIFRRFGLTDGSYTAIAKIKFVDEHDLEVVIKSGGLGIGYFMLTICIVFALALAIFLFLPELTKELELNLLAFVIGVPIFAFMSWLFLSRYVREPDIDGMENYLKNKVGGEWLEK